MRFNVLLLLRSLPNYMLYNNIVLIYHGREDQNSYNQVVRYTIDTNAIKL